VYRIKRTEAFARWLDGLKDRTPDPASREGCHGPSGRRKAGGRGVFEMREFFGPGWRMYCTLRGHMLIVMLGGGKKSTQQRNIARAIELAKSLED